MVKDIPLAWTLAFIFEVAALGVLYLGVLYRLLRRRPDWEAAGRARFRAHATNLAVFAAALCIFLGNGKRHLQVDTQPAAFGAMSLVRFGWFDLSPFERNVAPLKSAVLITGADGRTYTRYPPGSTIACIPFVLFGSEGRNFTMEQLDFASKRTGAFTSALAVAFLFAGLRRLGYGPGAWIATVATALGTTILSTASQDSWQHGPASLGAAVALYGLARTFPDDPRSAWIVGAGFGWAFLARTTMAVPAAIVGAYVASRDARRRLPWLALGALPFALFWTVYAWRVYGSPFSSGYIVNNPSEIEMKPAFFTSLYETFLNPSRGILVYSPFLALGALGLPLFFTRVRGWRDHDERAVSTGIFALSAFSIAAITAALAQWPGGWSYGYRSSTELATLLAPAVALASERAWTLPWTAARWAARAAVVAAVAVSIGIHALEWAFPNDIWNARPELQGTRTQISVHLEYARWRLGGGR